MRGTFVRDNVRLMTSLDGLLLIELVTVSGPTRISEHCLPTNSRVALCLTCSGINISPLWCVAFSYDALHSDLTGEISALSQVFKNAGTVHHQEMPSWRVICG